MLPDPTEEPNKPDTIAEKPNPSPGTPSNARAPAIVVTIIVATIVGLSLWYLAQPQPVLVQGEADALLTAKGDRISGRVTELLPLGEFAVWRAARAVNDHDLNSFLVRVDPTEASDGIEPGMTVWIEGTSHHD